MDKFINKEDLVNSEFYIDSFNLDRLFKEDTFKSNDGTDCTLNDEKKAKIKNSINTFFKGEKDFQCIKFFENALDGGANVYVAKADGKYIGIYEIGNDMRVDCAFQ